MSRLPRNERRPQPRLRGSAARILHRRASDVGEMPPTPLPPAVSIDLAAAPPPVAPEPAAPRRTPRLAAAALLGVILLAGLLVARAAIRKITEPGAQQTITAALGNGESIVAALGKAELPPTAEPAPSGDLIAMPAPSGDPIAMPAPSGDPIVIPAPSGDPIAAPAPKARTIAKSAVKAGPAPTPAAKLEPKPLDGPADARVRRKGYETIHGGLVFVPESFSSTDGAYDLVIHFHGNVKVVLESLEVARVNAVVAIINLGIGSLVYQDHFAAPGTYEGMLAEIQRAVGARRLASPRLRRVALSAWSAGYGSIQTILNLRRRSTPKPDAILMLDGIHCGWLEERPEALNPRGIAPFTRAARAAAAGEMLFTITHSEIDPITYASTQATAGYLLENAGGNLAVAPPGAQPPHLALRSVIGAVAKRLEKKMVPTTEGHIGDFHVRGFRGMTKEHHMAHLFQMAATVLPELTARWSPAAR
jgi:hypothetical protein